MQNFIKADILTEAKWTFKLMKIDVQQSKCNGREVKIGIATSLLLAKIKVTLQPYRYLLWLKLVNLASDSFMMIA